MGKVLIIGCGGVASVAIHKCCQNSEVFEEICKAKKNNIGQNGKIPKNKMRKFSWPKNLFTDKTNVQRESGAQ